MPPFGRAGKGIVQRAPDPGPPRELIGAIEGLTVHFRELNNSATAWKVTWRNSGVALPKPRVS